MNKGCLDELGTVRISNRTFLNCCNYRAYSERLVEGTLCNFPVANRA